MQIVTYNIQYGKGKDGRYDLARIADEVAGADIIALQEVECFWARSGNVHQPKKLAALLKDYYWVYGPGVDLAAPTGKAGKQRRHRRRQFGNMLLSKTPILYSRHHLLPKYGSIGPMSLQRSAIEGVVETPLGLLRIYSIHLTHLSAATRLPQVQKLWAVHGEAQLEGAPVTGDLKSDWTQDGMPPDVPPYAIWLGDFNFEADSEEYELIVGPNSPYGGRLVNPAGLVDAWVVDGHKEMAGVSAEIDGRSVRLDYCFVSTSLRDTISKVRIDGDAVGSDHQPVWTTLDPAKASN